MLLPAIDVNSNRVIKIVLDHGTLIVSHVLIIALFSK